VIAVRTELARFWSAAAACRNAVLRSLRPGRAELRRVAQEQGALRRVATMVARGASPVVAFNTVAAEVGRLLGADYTTINRYEPDATVSVVTVWCAPGIPKILPPLGGRWPVGTNTAAAAALRTGKPARRASESVGGDLGDWLRSHGIGHVVACPVTVEDRRWGVTVILFLGPEPPPPDTEERMRAFVELVGCTIAQAESRAELIASRARIIAASDTARRRIERDLHDGAQQHLISLALELRAAQAIPSDEHHELEQRLSDTAAGLSKVVVELQEISRGLHPAILARGGLNAALNTLAQRSPVPVELHLDTPRRLPEQIEVTAYYIVSEALTNVLKHAQASAVRVDLDIEADLVRLHVHDDGLGGADPGHGSGLIGLGDRVEALGGTLQISSPTGGGTSLLATIPLEHP
jgi:signal transduction histidine kinase